jgi:hypothetical protein
LVLFVNALDGAEVIDAKSRFEMTLRDAPTTRLVFSPLIAGFWTSVVEAFLLDSKPGQTDNLITRCPNFYNQGSRKRADRRNEIETVLPVSDASFNKIFSKFGRNDFTDQLVIEIEAELTPYVRTVLILSPARDACLRVAVDVPSKAAYQPDQTRNDRVDILR